MIKLRDYQQKIINSVRSNLVKGLKHLIVCAPTGSGKTVMFSYLAQQSSLKGKKGVIFTDRAELLLSSGGTLKNFGLNPYYIQAGTKYIQKHHNIYVAMSQTFRDRIKNDFWARWLKNEIDYVVIDEAHKQEFNYLFESGLIDDKIVLGFTATPKRSGKMRQLALDYQEIIEEVTVQDLVKMGYLVTDEYYGVLGADMSNIKINNRTGDYDKHEMFQRFNSTTLYAGVVKEWNKIAKGTQTIIFCVNIEHCIQTCEEFVKNGIDARFITSSMGIPKAPETDATDGAWARYEEKMRLYELYQDKFWRWSGERSKIFSQFENKEFPVLINAGIATTGYDNPTIETVVINRATNSVTLWLQMLGRGSRPNDGKTHFNIMDFGENAKRLEHYESPRLWSLWHTAENSGGGIPPMKDCGIDANGKMLPGPKIGCKRMIPLSTKICPFCGFKYPKKKAKEVELQGAYYDTNLNKVVHVKRVRDMSDLELVEYAKNKGHKQAWVWRQLYYRGGKDRIKKIAKELKWRSEVIINALNFCDSL